MQTLEMAQTYRVVLPAVEQLTVVLVGVGGTGSILAPALARLAYHLHGKGVTLKMLFVDHDVIERRNVLRQNFTEHEAGCFKVDALSFRLNAAFGLDITAVPAAFSAERFDEWTGGCDRGTEANLIISAVDNHLARRQIAQVIDSSHGRWYCLDLGNEHHSGQVLLGNATVPDAVKFDKLGLCTGLPSPYIQEPTLLEPPPVDADLVSCAELTLREEQSLVVNQQAAALAAHFAHQFLVRRELTQMATTFTLKPPTAKSRRITEANVHSCFV